MFFKTLQFKYVLLLILLISSVACFANDTVEQVELTALSRQLTMMQQTATLKAMQPINSKKRYYFDYKRFNADLQKMQQGINDYLSPTRAQPRDLLDLVGEYQKENKR